MVATSSNQLRGYGEDGCLFINEGLRKGPPWNSETLLNQIWRHSHHTMLESLKRIRHSPLRLEKFLTVQLKYDHCRVPQALSMALTNGGG